MKIIFNFSNFRIKMKQTDEKTESQKIEKLLERTLNEHFDRMRDLMNKRERKLSSAIPDAKYLPPKPINLGSQIQGRPRSSSTRIPQHNQKLI